MKIKIAICDDEDQSLKTIKEKVYEYSEKLNYAVEIFSYNSGKQIIDLICNKKEQIDILLLDIDMPESTGLEVAKTIREKNSDILLLFISAHDQYVYDTFEHNPYRYIRKHKMDIELFRALKSAYERIEANVEKTIFLRTDNGDERVKSSQIMYFERVDRKLDVYLSNGKKLIVRKNIKDFLGEINDDKFVQTHNGCAVNVKYVDGFSNFEVTLDNGEKIIMSRTRLKYVKSTLLKYWKGQQ